MKNRLLLVSLLLLLLTACSTSASPDLIEPDDDSVLPTESSELQPESQMPVPEISDPTFIPEEMIVIEENDIPSGTEPLVELSRQRLAAKFGFEPDEIRLLSITPTEWPDASLGCPQPGMAYAQVITPGYQIELAGGGQIFVFHTDVQSRIILCQSEGPYNIFIEP